MHVTDPAVRLDRAEEERTSYDAFVRALSEYQPDVGAMPRRATLPALDQAAVWRFLVNNAEREVPDELLASIESLDEAHGWWGVLCVDE